MFVVVTESADVMCNQWMSVVDLQATTTRPGTVLSQVQFMWYLMEITLYKRIEKPKNRSFVLQKLH